MADYIDRQAAIAALREFAEECNGSAEAATAAAMAISVISRLPGPWVSVEERLPERGKNVLTNDRNKYRSRVGRSFFGVAADKWHGPNYDDVVTHWMPLPDTPEVGTK